MNQVYRSVGTTKQNVHKRLERLHLQSEEAAQLVRVMQQVREDHPGMGGVNLYVLMQPQTMGRDRFLKLYNENNFRIKPLRNFRKTTDSSGVIRFPNLVADWELTGVNQVWVSDITYYEMSGRFYYLTFIMDLFSRKIKGYQASTTLRTVDTTIPALKMALKHLNEGDKPILHSDGGGQYYCKEFLTLTAGRTLNSMCESVYENPHAERVNGTIKNSYLRGYAPGNYRQLEIMLKKAVTKYNAEKPHDALAKLTPDYFESLHQPYSQKQELLTKEKRSKKENFTTTFNYN